MVLGRIEKRRAFRQVQFLFDYSKEERLRFPASIRITVLGNAYVVALEGATE